MVKIARGTAARRVPVAGRLALRRCLLKGCERWFEASRPQARYCSAACREAARRWRRGRRRGGIARRRTGRSSRRAQSRRYRERRRQPPAPDPSPDDAAEPREGQRTAGIPEDFPGCPCERPGCYVEFAPQARSPAAAFLLVGLPSGVTPRAAARAAVAGAASAGRSTAAVDAAAARPREARECRHVFSTRLSVRSLLPPPKRKGRAGGTCALPPSPSSRG